MLPHNHLRAYIEDVIVAVQEERGFDQQVALEQIKTFCAQLEMLQKRYSQAAPSGGEDLAEAMLEAVSHFKDSLKCLEDHFASPDVELLKRAYLESVAGSELMEALFEEASESESDGAGVLR